jgi:hypothetical protein
MRSVGRICALCLVLALAVGLGLASAAGAKKTKKAHFGSQLTLQVAGVDGFSGQVSAKAKVCRAQRQVAVYRVNSGPSVTSYEFVTSTWTHGDGSWTLPGPQYPGQYMAQVDTKTVPKTTHARAVICRSAYSNGATFG